MTKVAWRATDSLVAWYALGMLAGIITFAALVRYEVTLLTDSNTFRLVLLFMTLLLTAYLIRLSASDSANSS